MSALDAILDDCPELGVLPDAYRRLREALDNPKASASLIAATVRVDPVLSAGLLRLANSAALGQLTPVRTISRAAMVVGTEELHRLALALHVLRMFRGIPEHLLSMRSFWTHSVGSAILCHAWARARGRARTESLYVAGLLHDIGTLLLCTARPRVARTVLITAENEGLPVDQVERDLLGFDHAEVGAALLERWGIAERQVQAVRYHHRPSEGPENHQRAIDVVHLVSVSVSAIQLGNAGERAAHRLDRAAWVRHGLDPFLVQQLLERVQEEVRAVEDALALAPTGRRAPSLRAG